MDASAITKLVIAEPESDALVVLVRGRRLVSSRVAVVEVRKAVARADPDADPQAALALLAFVELDADLARIAGSTGGTALRALDAIHIASALALDGEVEAFITYDDRQAAAAENVGLNVLAPASR